MMLQVKLGLLYEFAVNRKKYVFVIKNKSFHHSDHANHQMLEVNPKTNKHIATSSSEFASPYVMNQDRQVKIGRREEPGSCNAKLMALIYPL